MIKYKKLKGAILMNNAELILKAAAEKLKEELEKENLYSFRVRSWKYLLELDSYSINSTFSFYVESDKDEKVEGHLHVRVSFVKHKSNKITTKAYKPKKGEYEYLLNLYKIAMSAFLVLAKEEGKEGLVVTHEDYMLDEKLANQFRKSFKDVSPLNYSNEIVELASNVCGLNILGLRLNDKFIQDAESSMKTIHKVKNIIEEHPLLSLNTTNYSEALKILDNEILVNYVGVTLSWSLANDKELAIKVYNEKREPDRVSITAEAVQEYLDSFKEESKFSILLSKPKHNYHALLNQLKYVNEISKISDFYAFYFNDEATKNGFSILEDTFGNWEDVEALYIKLLPEYKDGKFLVKEYASLTKDSSRTIVFTFEYKVNDKYIYFVMANKANKSDNDRDDLKVIISEVQTPIELKELLFELLN